MARPLRTVSPDAALDQVGGGWDTEAAGLLASGPVLAIDVGAGPVTEALTAFAARVPAVVIGVARHRVPVLDAPRFDILLTNDSAPPAPWVGVDDVDASLTSLSDAIDNSPAAAVILVQLLRLSRDLTVTDGLIAESLAYSLLQGGPAHRAWLESRPPPHPSDRDRHAVVVERAGDRLFIRLNRPHVHNAYDRATRDELAAAFQLAVADASIAGIELSGAGPSFCSGGDLTEFGTLEDPVSAHLVRTTRSPAALLAGVASRTVAFVHGSCVGAGVELPAFAERVVADAATTFRLPEVAMGLIPGAGGTVSLPRRIGRSRTAYLAISGEALRAPTALAWGLVDELTRSA